MKQLNLLLALLMAAVQLSSQPPQKFNYQAIARNTNGAAVVNQNINARFTIKSLSATGTILYQETQTFITNQFGLFSHQVGNGTVVQGVFSSINWAGDKYFQVELDLAGGNNFIDFGTSQLISVPYALYARQSEIDNDQQTLSWDNNSKTLTISGGNSVTIPPGNANVGPTGNTGPTGSTGATGYNR